MRMNVIVLADSLHDACELCCSNRKQNVKSEIENELTHITHILDMHYTST